MSAASNGDIPSDDGYVVPLSPLLLSVQFLAKEGARALALRAWCLTHAQVSIACCVSAGPGV